MLRKPAYDWPMISAEDLRDARLRAGYTSQASLADALGVSERTVTNWESEGGHVSGRAEAKVRALLWPAPGPLSSYSNYELLSELGRRLDRSSRRETSGSEGEESGSTLPGKGSGVPRRNPISGTAGPSLRRRRNDAHTEDR